MMQHPWCYLNSPSEVHSSKSLTMTDMVSSGRYTKASKISKPEA